MMQNNGDKSLIHLVTTWNLQQFNLSIIDSVHIYHCYI